jgi:hypothetical protein
MADYTGDLPNLPFQPFQEVKCLEPLHKMLSEHLFLWKGLSEMCSGILDVDVNVQENGRKRR